MPDVVLMDVRMPKVSGIEATRAIAASVPTTKILMLTVSDEEEDLYEAVKAGASGYLLKEISIEEVADAIRAVITGQSLISPSMASKLLAEFNTLAKAAEEQVAAPKLTDRELQVLKLVAQGMSNREVAEQLFISENTVKNHVRNILEKLHLHSRMEAVIYAVRGEDLGHPVGELLHRGSRGHLERRRRRAKTTIARRPAPRLTPLSGSRAPPVHATRGDPVSRSRVGREGDFGSESPETPFVLPVRELRLDVPPTHRDRPPQPLPLPLEPPPRRRPRRPGIGCRSSMEPIAIHVRATASGS